MPWRAGWVEEGIVMVLSLVSRNGGFDVLLWIVDT